MAVSTDDLAKLLVLYEAQYLDADDLLTPAASGSGLVYPDHQTRSVLAYLEDVPAGRGGLDIPTDGVSIPSDHDTYYEPPIARLYWFNNGRLVRRDDVHCLEQWFHVPIWSKENVIAWVCTAPAKLGLWRMYDSSATFPF